MPEKGSPATLVAIAVAARQAGDKELERDTRQKLKERFGVIINFPKEKAVAATGVQHDK